MGTSLFKSPVKYLNVSKLKFKINCYAPPPIQTLTYKFSYKVRSYLTCNFAFCLFSHRIWGWSFPNVFRFCSFDYFSSFCHYKIMVIGFYIYIVYGFIFQNKFIGSQVNGPSDRRHLRARMCVCVCVCEYIWICTWIYTHPPWMWDPVSTELRLYSYCLCKYVLACMWIDLLREIK